MLKVKIGIVPKIVEIIFESNQGHIIFDVTFV